MPTELISLIGGSLTGFIFRFLAQKSQDQKELFERLITANKQTTDNQEKAAKRVPIDVGKGVRQLIVLQFYSEPLLLLSFFHSLEFLPSLKSMVITPKPYLV